VAGERARKLQGRLRVFCDQPGERDTKIVELPLVRVEGRLLSLLDRLGLLLG